MKGNLLLLFAFIGTVVLMFISAFSLGTLLKDVPNINENSVFVFIFVVCLCGTAILSYIAYTCRHIDNIKKLDNEVTNYQEKKEQLDTLINAYNTALIENRKNG